MKKYNYKKIEPKWQKFWQDNSFYQADDKKSGIQEDKNSSKYYCLIEFPYPSGDGLHVGHVRSYTALDVVTRHKRMQGKNVLYPIGWDAFGLPTENYAIKTGKQPAVVTKENVKVFKRQIQRLGISFDWSREINTTEPKYYKWTQWIFLQLFKHGLAYKKKMAINWCPSCKIGLANEEVVEGNCERCGTESTKKDLNQWMLNIRKYADRLIDDLDEVEFLDKIKTQQINWIGRSEGANVKFQISKLRNQNDELSLEVFTTRPDTLFGATYMVLSPEHELVEKITTEENLEKVKKYQKQARTKSDLERTELQKEKTGVFTGAYAINPVNNEQIPIWLADYVLSSYGTGAIMAVPAHDQRDYEFAKKYDLEIREVISGGDISKEAFTEIENGQMVNSDFLNDLKPNKAIEEITKWLEKEKLGKKEINYKLRDWVFSRQHYWGEPIPLIFCKKCDKWIALDEKELPLKLPEVEKYEPTDTGESPLAVIEDWVKVKCPKCGGEARRETDTMPNWAGSSWYFLRYIDPNNDETFADFDKLKYWTPVDLYNGGMEHTTLHLLYSRFWHKFLFDIGVVPTKEPYQRRVSHGMILAEDSQKMSKSRGNVISPDIIIEEFGADVLRVYEMFIGPYDQEVAWNTKGMRGIKRFLDRIYSFAQKDFIKKDTSEVLTLLHQTIKKVGTDIEEMKFNTAVSSLMILLNKIEEDGCTKESFATFIKLLNIFAPFLSEEVWQMLGNKESVTLEKWPKFDEKLMIEDNFNLVVQINGKVRDSFEVKKGLEESEVKSLVLAREKVQKYLEDKEIRKFIYVKDRLVNIVM